MKGARQERSDLWFHFRTLWWPSPPSIQTLVLESPWKNPNNKGRKEGRMEVCFKPVPPTPTPSSEVTNAITLVWILSDLLLCLHLHAHSHTHIYLHRHKFFLLRKGAHIPRTHCGSFSFIHSSIYLCIFFFPSVSMPNMELRLTTPRSQVAYAPLTEPVRSPSVSFIFTALYYSTLWLDHSLFVCLSFGG